MLASSSEYLIALHSGKYLVFLDWVISFLPKKYNGAKQALPGDVLLNCLIFEWLKAGDCKADVDKIAILYAVSMSQSSPIQTGKYAFALTMVISGLYWCHAFNSYLNKVATKEQQEEIREFLGDQKQASEIYAFVERHKVKIGDLFFTQATEAVEKEIQQTPAQSLIDAAVNHMSAITQPLAILEHYVQALGQEQQALVNNDGFYNTRLGLLKSLTNYLHEQTELTPQVSQKIVEYVNNIRRQQPAAWEESEYLQKVCPTTYTETAWKIISWGIGFFAKMTPRQDSEDATPSYDIKELS